MRICEKKIEQFFILIRLSVVSFIQIFDSSCYEQYFKDTIQKLNNSCDMYYDALNDDNDYVDDPMKID